MVFEKKQLSKALAIALMVACAVAFMPLLNGQAFAAAKKPAKVKSLKAAQVADTMTAKATWKKGKNCKKYNVKVDGVLVSKKQKAKSYTTTELSEGVHKIAVAGVNGKKVGKYKTVKVEIKSVTPPTPVGKLEMTGFVQSGVKQFKVTFSQPITDPSALKFVVTRDGKEITCTAKADPNDQFSVLLDMDSAIVDGSKYDIAVTTADGTAVQPAAGASTEVTGQKEKVDAIAIDETLILDADADTATANDRTGEVAYTIKNQFGEDVTSKYYTKLNVSTTIGTTTPVPEKEAIKIKDILDIQAIPGTKGTIVAVYTETGVNTTQEVTVGAPAKIDAVKINGLYDSAKKVEAPIIAKAEKGNADVIAFQATDQYGRAYEVVDTEITANVIGGLTGLDKKATDWLGSMTIDDVDYQTIKLAGVENANAGSASAIIVANATGARDQYDFTVGDENVIADLTVIPPTDVIGAADNIFTVEATNAAGEAITDYDLLKNGIKIGNNGASNNGTWQWKKLKDGSGQLILKAKHVDADTLTSEVFQAVDTYKTSFVTFTIKTGTGVPYEITDITTNAEIGASNFVLLDSLKIVDVYGKKIDVAAAQSDGYMVLVSQPDYGKTDATVYQYEGATAPTARPDAADLTPVKTDGKRIALDELGTIGVMYEGEDAGAANAKVNVILQKQNTAGEWVSVLTSEYTETFSVSEGVAVYDSYKVYATAAGVYGDDINTIYLGTANAEGTDWKDEPSVTTFDLSVVGLMNGSSREYPIAESDYRLEDTAELISGNDTLTITPAEAKKALAEDTISLLIPSKGSAAVATKTIAFSADEPVVTAFNKDDNEDLKIDEEVLDQDGVASVVVFRDQYGVAVSNADMTVALNSVTNTDGDYVAPGEDSYVVNYDGTKFFSIDNANGTIQPGFVLGATVVNGDVSADVDMTVTYDPRATTMVSTKTVTGARTGYNNRFEMDRSSAITNGGIYFVDQHEVQMTTQPSSNQLTPGRNTVMKLDADGKTWVAAVNGTDYNFDNRGYGNTARFLQDGTYKVTYTSTRYGSVDVVVVVETPTIGD